MADIELVIKISEEQYNTIKSDLYNTFPAEMKKWGLEAIRNGTPLEEELHREKEQAYYLGYEDARKSEWTAAAESEDKE